MTRRLLVVRRRLWVRGKGLAVEPGVVPVPGERIRAGDQVSVRRPDGSTLEAMIRGTSTDSASSAAGPVHLWLDLANKDEVPIGSEVWSAGG